MPTIPDFSDEHDFLDEVITASESQNPGFSEKVDAALAARAPSVDPLVTRRLAVVARLEASGCQLGYSDPDVEVWWTQKSEVRRIPTNGSRMSVSNQMAMLADVERDLGMSTAPLKTQLTPPAATVQFLIDGKWADCSVAILGRGGVFRFEPGGPAYRATRESERSEGGGWSIGYEPIAACLAPDQTRKALVLRGDAWEIAAFEAVRKGDTFCVVEDGRVQPMPCIAAGDAYLHPTPAGLVWAINGDPAPIPTPEMPDAVAPPPPAQQEATKGKPALDPGIEIAVALVSSRGLIVEDSGDGYSRKEAIEAGEVKCYPYISGRVEKGLKVEDVIKQIQLISWDYYRYQKPTVDRLYSEEPFLDEPEIVVVHWETNGLHSPPVYRRYGPPLDRAIGPGTDGVGDGKPSADDAAAKVEAAEALPGSGVAWDHLRTELSPFAAAGVQPTQWGPNHNRCGGTGELPDPLAYDGWSGDCPGCAGCQDPPDSPLCPDLQP